MGCTIRYEYGLFRQKLVDGYQVEVPDNWLDDGNVWEVPRPDQTVEVHFGGRVEEFEENGRMNFRTVDYRGGGGRSLRYSHRGLRFQHGEHAARVVGALAQALRYEVL